jgi:hypothetical protein
MIPDLHALSSNPSAAQAKTVAVSFRRCNNR